ncbi:hypothetical protein [Nocardia jiangxiensis]|uniref:Uncharacterized protein n=1 Tax=Nocardia jiangxiensis TaxID=282685 RepID=A0ABW6RSF6_9NOCA|nr:hypothetical protein [Nocardia jiangxiensis]
MTEPVVVRDQARGEAAGGVAAYARRAGIDTATFTAALEPLLTPATVGAEIARLCRDTGNQYQLTCHGLHAPA